MNLEPCTLCEAPAAWKCASCGPKCADHVVRVRGPLQRFRCADDGDEAELLRVRRGELHRFTDKVKLSALAPLAAPRVLVSTIVCAIVLFSITFLSIVGVALGVSALLVLGLRLVRSTADAEEFDWPPPAEAMEQVLMPVARGLAACLVPMIVLYVGVYVFVVSPFDIEPEHRRTLALTLAMHPSFWLSSLIAVATIPFMLLNAAVSTDWATVFNPVAALAPIRRFHREYGWISLVSGAGMLLTFLIRWGLPRGYFGNFVAAMLASWTVFATFRLLGELVWLNPEEFNWGAVDEGWIDLGDASKPRVEEVVPAPRTSAPAASAVAPEVQVNAALDNKDVTSALRLFKETPNSDVTFATATLLRVGQAAASVSEHALALSALLAAGRADSPDAARALVIAARILDERMRDQDGAKRLFQQVMQRFPGSQAGEFARKQLADPRFFLSRKA